MNGKCLAWMVVLASSLVLNAHASGIDVSMRLADKRMDAPVSISARRICLGELLTQISKQTGIALHVRDTEPASGLHLTVTCTATPAADLLDSLSTIASIRDDEWKWRRDGAPGSFSYNLLPPHQSALRADHLRTAAEAALENYVDLMIKLSYELPDERRRSRRKISEALNQKDDQIADNLISQTTMWDYVRLFAEVTPQDLRYKVVRGEQEINAPVKSLSAEAQSLFHKVWSHFDLRTNGVQDPEPTLVHFYSRANVAVVPAVVPALWFDLGAGNGSVTILGGYLLEGGVRSYIRKLWMLPGDSEDNPQDQRHVTSVVALPGTPAAAIGASENGPELMSQILDTRLCQLEKGSSIPVITLLPWTQGHDPGDPAAYSTVSGYLNKLKTQTLSPMYKWRGPVLVVTYPEWFMEDNDDLAVPYQLIRSYLSSSDHFVRLIDMVGIFSGVTLHQANDLAQEYRAIRALVALYPICMVARRSPEITSADGMRLDADKTALLRAYPQFARSSALADGSAASLRLRQETGMLEGRQTLVIRAELLVADKRWEPLYSVTEIEPPSTPLRPK